MILVSSLTTKLLYCASLLFSTSRFDDSTFYGSIYVSLKGDGNSGLGEGFIASYVRYSSSIFGIFSLLFAATLFSFIPCLEGSSACFSARLSLVKMHPMINDDYIIIHNKKYQAEQEDCKMRKQQITPWSIYNKTIINEGEKGEKEVIRFPKIEKKSGSIRLRQELLVEKGRHSARQVMDVMKHDKEAFSPYLSEFIAKNEEIEKRRQYEMQGKQADIEKVMNNRVVLQMIKAELRREHSQLDFMNLLKDQQPEQVEPSQTLSINIKRNHSFLLDRHPFPRVNVDKNVMLINLNHSESPPNSEEKPAKDTQTTKAILKKEINSMISNRMKIMGKAKQLAYKP